MTLYAGVARERTCLEHESVTLTVLRKPEFAQVQSTNAVFHRRILRQARLTQQFR